MKFASGLGDNARETSIELLNQCLADAIDLQLAVKQAHWTIKGSSFIGLHELLDQVANRSREHSDLLAERCVILGGQPQGTTQAVAKDTRLESYPTGVTKQNEHVAAMTERLMSFGENLRNAITSADEAGDIDTSDLFTEISREVDKDAWFIGAHNYD